MTRRSLPRLTIALIASSSLPVLAHVGAGTTPHWHAGDAWGALAVVAITAAAAWLDRRGR